MCTQSVTQRYSDRQAGKINAAASSDETQGLDSNPSTTPAPCSDGPRKAPRTVRTGDRSSWWPGDGRPVERCRCLLDCSWLKSPAGCRRAAPRVAGIVLSEPERELLRHQYEQVSGCRTRLMALQRSKTGPGGLHIERLVVELPCGSRLCPECDSTMRARHQWRAEGFWSQFVTLGVTRAYGNQREAWKKVITDVGRLTREIRRRATEHGQDDVKIHKKALDANALVREISGDERIADDKLQIAWAVEPHESGFPHVHIILNTRWIRGEWLKRVWSSITGCKIRWCDIGTVWSIGGVCRYLCEYIAKAQLPGDILCLVYRRRLFYSTLPVKWKPPEGWTQTHERDQAYLRQETAREPGEVTFDGWLIERSKEGRYVNSKRIEEYSSRELWMLVYGQDYDGWKAPGSWGAAYHDMRKLAARYGGMWEERSYHKPHRRRKKILVAA